MRLGDSPSACVIGAIAGGRAIARRRRSARRPRRLRRKRRRSTPAPAKVPATFGIGRPATPAEIAALDIDIGPDGAGLPPGRGTAADGAPIYAARCAGCHGKTGKEGPNDVLVGRLPGDAFPFARDPRAPKTIGSYWPYATTVFDYIRRAMPPDAPGSLKDEEVYGLVAYLLALNELIPQDAVDRRGVAAEGARCRRALTSCRTRAGSPRRHLRRDVLRTDGVPLVAQAIRPAPRPPAALKGCATSYVVSGFSSAEALAKAVSLPGSTSAPSRARTPGRRRPRS